MKFSMKCTCGHVMVADGKNRADAVAEMKKMMTLAALKKHISDYHPKGEPVPTLAQAHAMIEKQVVKGVVKGPRL